MYSCFCIILISYTSVIVWCTDNRYTHVNKPVEKLNLCSQFVCFFLFSAEEITGASVYWLCLSYFVKSTPFFKNKAILEL